MEEVPLEGAEVLEVVGKGDPLVSYLALPAEGCDEYLRRYRGKFLGSGMYGAAWELNLPGRGRRKFALKDGPLHLRKVPSTSLTEDEAGLAAIFDPGWPPRSPKAVLIPQGGACITRRNELFGEPGRGFVVPKGSFICEDSFFSEYVIGRMVGRAFARGECANFFEVRSLFVCPMPRGKYSWNVVMDKIDGDFERGATCTALGNYVENAFFADAFVSAFVQTLFAVAFLQEHFAVSHNDLHLGNIFAEYVTEDTVFDGQELLGADWFRYDLGKGREIFLPASPAIVKIGDYGLAVKYPHPLVGDKNVFTHGYNQMDGYGPMVPCEYSPTYDSVYVGSEFKGFASSGIWKGGNDEVYALASLVCPDGFVHAHSGRPILSKLKEAKDAKSVLRGVEFAQRFGTKPAEGKVVTLGRL